MRNDENGLWICENCNGEFEPSELTTVEGYGDYGDGPRLYSLLFCADCENAFTLGKRTQTALQEGKAHA